MCRCQILKDVVYKSFLSQGSRELDTQTWKEQGDGDGDGRRRGERMYCASSTTAAAEFSY